MSAVNKWGLATYPCHCHCPVLSRSRPCMCIIQPGRPPLPVRTSGPQRHEVLTAHLCQLQLMLLTVWLMKACRSDLWQCWNLHESTSTLSQSANRCAPMSVGVILYVSQRRPAVKEKKPKILAVVHGRDRHRSGRIWTFVYASKSCDARSNKVIIIF